MALKRLSTLKLNHLLQPRQFSNEANKLVSLQLDPKTGIATLEMQRPPVNSLNLELVTALNSSLLECEKQKCRGLILASSSETVFSAGLDITEMYKPDPERVRTFWTILQDTWMRLYGSPYPTVAAISGHAPAGGCLLSISCEYRVMRKGFTIGLNETKLGIVAPFWFVDSMSNVIGTRQAELALTLGRMFTTEEALDVGLVDEVAESKEEVLSRAGSFLQQYAKIIPLARALTKQVVRGDTVKKLAKRRDEDLNTFVGYVENEMVQKALGAYMESLKKRKAA